MKKGRSWLFQIKTWRIPKISSPIEGEESEDHNHAPQKFWIDFRTKLIENWCKAEALSFLTGFPKSNCNKIFPITGVHIAEHKHNHAYRAHQIRLLQRGSISGKTSFWVVRTNGFTDVANFMRTFTAFLKQKIRRAYSRACWKFLWRITQIALQVAGCF